MQQEYEDFTWLFKNYQNLFDQFGMNKDNVVEVYQEWKEEPEDTVVKYLWAILEKLLFEATNIDKLEIRYRALSIVYKEMRNYKTRYEGDKANDLHKKHLFYSLKEYELLAGNTEAKVSLVASHCCAYCGSYDQIRVTIKEALVEQYLPEQRCANELGCNCFYKVEY